jgi:hypothetical protein
LKPRGQRRHCWKQERRGDTVENERIREDCLKQQYVRDCVETVETDIRLGHRRDRLKFQCREAVGRKNMN